MSEPNLETVGERYRLDRQRTEFPFGTLWEADDTQGGRVLLLLSEAGVESADSAALRAMERSSEVDSQNAIPWSDAGATDDGRFWLVAPLLGSQTFSELVARSEGLEPAESAPIVQQVARAVAAAERADVHHLALCGELVRLLELEDGRFGVKVYGFGLAGLLPPYKPLRKRDPFLGVPDYMAPELCQGKSAGTPADVYAMGIMLYEAIRGKPPFASRSARASASTTLKRQIFEKPLALHMRYGGLDHIKAYEDITLRALSKTASQRHQGAGELQEELEGFMAGEMDTPPVPEDAVPGASAAATGPQKTQVLEGFADQARAMQARIDADKRVEEARRRLSEASEEEDGDGDSQDDETADETQAEAAEADDGRDEAAEDETADAADTGDAGPKTLVTQGLSPEVKALADGAEVTDEDDSDKTVVDQRAITPDDEEGAPSTRKGKKSRKKRPADDAVSPQPDETGAGAAMDEEAAPSAEDKSRPRGEEDQTVMDFPGVGADREGVDEEWFVERPEELGAASAQPDYFSPDRKRRPYLMIAGLLLLAVIVGLVWYLTRSEADAEETAGSVEGSQTAAVERPKTAAEVLRARREAARGALRERPEEQGRADKARRAREALQDRVLAPGAEEAAEAPSDQGDPTESEGEANAEADGEAEGDGNAEAAEADPEAEPEGVEEAPEAAEKPPARRRPRARPSPPPEPAAETQKAEPAPKPEPRKQRTGAAKPEPKPEPDREAAAEEEPAAEPKPEPEEDRRAEAEPEPEGEPSEEERKAQSKAAMKKGLQALKAKAYEEAIGHFRQAERLDPDNALASKYLGVAQKKMGE